MGSQVIAICKCGLHSNILIGGGMRTFNDINYFPCLCEDCEDVVQVNLVEHEYGEIDLKHFPLSSSGERYKPEKIPLKERKLTCPKCQNHRVTSYTDLRLVGDAGQNTVAQSFRNVLTNGTYKCPKCKKMTLKFSVFQGF